MNKIKSSVMRRARFNSNLGEQGFHLNALDCQDPLTGLVSLLVPTMSPAGYTAGKDAAYTARLTLRGYPPARLDGLNAELDALGGSDAHATSEAGDAQYSTEQRNTAYQALRDWMTELKGVALGLFRKSPSSRHKLQR